MTKPHRDCFTTSVSEKLQWFKQCLWDGELGRQSQLALADLLHGALEEDINHQLGIGRAYERGPQRLDQRNGHYQRVLETAFGPAVVRVPRSRHNTYEPTVFDAYQRRMAQVDEIICRLFTGGLSTRAVAEVMDLICGCQVSATTVSAVAQALDRHVAAYHQRPLKDHYTYLALDGIHLRCKGADGPSHRVVLVAYGLGPGGRKELIGFRQAPSEGERHWTTFLQDLYRRGLTGQRLVLVTTDGAAGLIAALDFVYPQALRQRCWAHKLRNLAGKLRHAHREACLKQAGTIYQAPTYQEAVRRFRRWRTQWQEREPKAVACLHADIDPLLAHFVVPLPDRIKVRTTNPIERAFREVRRRTRPMSCFNNPASIDRIIFAVFARLNSNWEKRAR
jgi:putative transposase